MPASHSRAGKDVLRLKISDEPHEKYQTCDPWTGQRIVPGIPILNSTAHGNIINKRIEYYNVKCPECEIKAEYNESSEPVCPSCGIICSGKDTIMSEQMVRDAKAAGRVDGGN
jgi:ribosomal protein S27E